jgi:hypothetical protein
MTATIDVSCPECKKQVKATTELQGKKVRCKGCGHVFTIPAAAPGKDAKPAPAKAAAKPADDDDLKAYSVTAAADDAKPRCPHCAMELENEDVVICIHCGYNLKTRQRLGTKKTYDVTAADRSAWLMPGFIALAAIFGLIVFDLFFCLALPRMVERGDWEWLAAGGVRLWVVIFSIGAMLVLAKFAYQRLIVEPNPPEKTRG